MLSYPFDPVIFQLGAFKLYWFAVLYLLALAACWGLARVLARRQPALWTMEGVNDLTVYIALGLVIGGRLGGVLFYHLAEFLNHPLVLFEVWRGGLSSHGALIGGFVAAALFARRSHKGLFEVSDFLAPLAPVVILAGHLADFVSGESWGNITSADWGMVFPRADLELRYPVQLYGAFTEGLLLFGVLWWMAGKQPRTKVLTGSFLFLYGAFHIAMEVFRAPEPQLGYLAWGWLTMGQLLSLPVLLAGAQLLYSAFKDKHKETQAV